MLLQVYGMKEHSNSSKKLVPGELVPKSGIYRVTHDSHRLMHEATLLKNDRFPVCKQCGQQVRFELLRAVKNPRILSGYHAILEDYSDPETLIVT
jgi:hypothetical protein